MNEVELQAGLPVTPQYRYAQRVGKQLFVAGQVPPATLLGIANLGYVGQLVEIDATVIKS